MKAALGLAPDDAIVGFLYIGTRPQPKPPRELPDLDGLVSEWTPHGL